MALNDRSAACPNCGHALAKTNRGWWWCSRCERRMRLKDSVGGSALLTSGAARQASLTPTDSAASRRAWALRICTIAFVICGMVFRWWWPVVVLAALLLVIDGWAALERSMRRG